MATAFPWRDVTNGTTRLAEPRVIRGQGKAPQQLRPAPGKFGLKEGRGLAARRQQAMVEFHTAKKIDNSRLVRHVEPVKLRSYYKIAALGSLVAMCFVLYIYQHFRCIDLSFQLEDQKSKQMQAQALNGQLRLEIESWRNPHRINVIAQQLGLQRPAATQVLEYSTFDGQPVEAARFVRGNRAQ